MRESDVCTAVLREDRRRERGGSPSSTPYTYRLSLWPYKVESERGQRERERQGELHCSSRQNDRNRERGPAVQSKKYVREGERKERGIIEKLYEGYELEFNVKRERKREGGGGQRTSLGCALSDAIQIYAKSQLPDKTISFI